MDKATNEAVLKELGEAENELSELKNTVQHKKDQSVQKFYNLSYMLGTDVDKLLRYLGNLERQFEELEELRKKNKTRAELKAVTKKNLLNDDDVKAEVTRLLLEDEEDLRKKKSILAKFESDMAALNEETCKEGLKREVMVKKSIGIGEEEIKLLETLERELSEFEDLVKNEGSLLEKVNDLREKARLREELEEKELEKVEFKKDHNKIRLVNDEMRDLREELEEKEKEKAKEKALRDKKGRDGSGGTDEEEISELDENLKTQGEMLRETLEDLRKKERIFAKLRDLREKKANAELNDLEAEEARLFEKLEILREKVKIFKELEEVKGNDVEKKRGLFEALEDLSEKRGVFVVV